MKKMIFALLLMQTSMAVRAQSTVKDSIHVSVEQMPEFPGGQEGFIRYLSSVVRYPDSAYKHRVAGRVFVQMTIEKDGSVTDAKIVRSVSTDLDSEALRVVNSSPKWKPGLVAGDPVRVSYTVPIKFSLGEPIQKRDTAVVDKSKFAPVGTDPNGKNIESDQIFTSVKMMPEFPGGRVGFNAYIKKNLKCPPPDPVTLMAG